MQRMKLRASNHTIECSKRGTLADRGANGGMLGNDAKVTFRQNKGEVILILRNCAHHGANRTLHSSGQIECCQNKVCDGSIKAGGQQVVVTRDGCYVPINIIRGSPCVQMEPNTADEFDKLPHVALTQGGEWDPSVPGHILTDDEDWVSKVKRERDPIYESPFDLRGECKHRKSPAIENTIDSPAGPPNEDPDDIEVNFHKVDTTLEIHKAYHRALNLNQIYACEGEGMPDDDESDKHADILDDDKEDGIKTYPPTETKPKPINYSKCRAHFLHAPIEKIRRTFQVTTQNAADVTSGGKIQQTLKSLNPASNAPRRNEAVATNTMFANAAAVDTPGYTCAQMFVGRSSLLADTCRMVSTNEFANTLLNCIGDRGAMDKLISDQANCETSSRVKDMLRALVIGHWKSEPHCQHQNFAEHRWGHIKSNLEWLMAFLDVDPHCWLLALNHVCTVMKLTAERSLGWRPPMEVAAGITQDISTLLHFMFWDIVCCARCANKQPGSQKGKEMHGRFVRFVFDVGHALTFLVLTDDTRKVIN